MKLKKKMKLKKRWTKKEYETKKEDENLKKRLKWKKMKPKLSAWNRLKLEKFETESDWRTNWPLTANRFETGGCRSDSRMQFDGCSHLENMLELFNFLLALYLSSSDS